MKKLNAVLIVCLAVGFAVFMAADSSIAAGIFLGKDAKIFGNGHGPGNGTGNGGSGSKDGTGKGSKSGTGTCPNIISDLPTDGMLISGKGNGNGHGPGNGSDNGGNGHGPGNGTGNGGNGPKDGTGKGSKKGTCTNLISETPNGGILI